MKIVREHYLRDDIGCGASGCAACGPERTRDPVLELQPGPQGQQPLPAATLLLPDTNVLSAGAPVGGQTAAPSPTRKKGRRGHCGPRRSVLGSITYSGRANPTGTHASCPQAGSFLTFFNLFFLTFTFLSSWSYKNFRSVNFLTPVSLLP